MKAIAAFCSPLENGTCLKIKTVRDDKSHVTLLLFPQSRRGPKFVSMEAVGVHLEKREVVEVDGVGMNELVCWFTSPPQCLELPLGANLCVSLLFPVLCSVFLCFLLVRSVLWAIFFFCRRAIRVKSINCD